MALSEIHVSSAKLNPINRFYMYSLDVATMIIDDLIVAGDLLVEGNLEVDGDTLLLGTLDADGITTLASTLFVQDRIEVDSANPTLVLFNNAVNVNGAALSLNARVSTLNPFVIKQYSDGKAEIKNNEVKDIEITSSGAGNIIVATGTGNINLSPGTGGLSNIQKPVLLNSVDIPASVSAPYLNATGLVKSKVLANGQLLIGAGAGTDPSAANITAGTGITVTDGAGSISVALTAILPVSYTPVLSFGGVAATGFATQFGSYLQSGKIVYFTVAISLNGAPTIPAGNATINLPPISGGAGNAAIPFAYCDAIINSFGPFSLLAGGTTGELFQYNQVSSALVALNNTNFQALSNFVISGFYFSF